MAGARDDGRERALRRLPLRFHLLAFDTVGDYDAAAPSTADAGEKASRPAAWWTASSPRWPVAEATLLAQDAHLSRMARVVAIELGGGSFTA